MTKPIIFGETHIHEIFAEKPCVADQQSSFEAQPVQYDFFDLLGCSIQTNPQLINGGAK